MSTSLSAAAAQPGVDIPFTGARIRYTGACYRLELLVNGKWLSARDLTSYTDVPIWLESHGLLALDPALAEMVDDIVIPARNPWGDETSARRLSGVTDDPAVLYLWRKLREAEGDYYPVGSAKPWPKEPMPDREFTPEEIQAALAERVKGRIAFLPREPRTEPVDRENPGPKITHVVCPKDVPPAGSTAPKPPRPAHEIRSPGSPVKPGAKKSIEEIKTIMSKMKKPPTGAGPDASA